jgi:hypothetical protein
MPANAGYVRDCIEVLSAVLALSGTNVGHVQLPLLTRL